MANPDQIVITPVVKNCGQLLEGPHWQAASQTLYFVDILGNAVHRYRPADGGHEKVNVGTYISCSVISCILHGHGLGRSRYLFIARSVQWRH